MAWTPDAGALRGKVAVVAGATRGAGRGIALALGEAGATVVCTGRSSRAGGPTRSDYTGRTETIEETAELVTGLGGTGVAAAVDHLDHAQVAALAARLRADHGPIAVLVNDIWGGDQLVGGPANWNKAIWEADLDAGLRLLRLAVETHLVTSYHLLPLLVTEPGGLLVEVTDGTTAYNDTHYRVSAFYDLAKAAVNRLAWSQGHERAAHGATAVALTPGFLRSEMMLENFGVTEPTWREARGPTSWQVSESPRFVGRAVAALAADPERSRWNQQSVDSGHLGRVYGFCDLDGSRPDVWRFIADEEAGLDPNPQDYRDASP